MEQQSMMSTEKEGIHSPLTADEIEVCEILLNLPNLIVESDSRLQSPRSRKPFLVRWGTQKRLICRGATRRGSTSASPPNNLATTTTTTPSKSPSPLPSLQNNTTSEEQVKVVGDASPNTPLSFASSTTTETNDKPSHRKNSKNTEVIEELKKNIVGLNESREVLRKEVENVKSYYNDLLAYNAKLKARKQQVLSTSTCHAREEPNSDLNKSLNPRLNCVRSYQIPAITNQNQFTGEKMAVESLRPGQLQFQYPYGHGQMQVRPNLGPSDMYNLNAAATEGTPGVASSQPLDYSRDLADNINRAKAAEARRKRKMIITQQKLMLKPKARVMKPPFSSR